LLSRKDPYAKRTPGRPDDWIQRAVST